MVQTTFLASWPPQTPPTKARWFRQILGERAIPHHLTPTSPLSKLPPRPPLLGTKNPGHPGQVRSERRPKPSGERPGDLRAAQPGGHPRGAHRAGAAEEVRRGLPGLPGARGATISGWGQGRFFFFLFSRATEGKGGGLGREVFF